jgi:hypothetical protein
MKTRYLLLFFLIFSCKSNQKTIYEFDPRKINDTKLLLSEVITNITYIPLESSIPIGLIYKPKYFINNHIYISSQNNGLMAFDKKGKYLRKIGAIGRGPGEYANYYEFTVDDKSESIYVMDFNVIKVYSKTGIFLRSIPLHEYGIGATYIDIYNSRLFISFSPQIEGTKFDWIIMDSIGNLVQKKYRSILPFTSNWLITGGMYRFGNKIYHWNPYSDTIYSIKSDLKYETSFLLSPGEHRLPKSDFDAVKYFSLYFHPYSIFETKHFIGIKYFYKKLTIAMIGKQDNRSHLIYLDQNEKGGIVNDFDGGPDFQPQNYFEEDGHEYIVGILDALQIKSLLKRSNLVPKYTEKGKEMNKLANSLKETDNPVLMIVQLKK